MEELLHQVHRLLEASGATRGADAGVDSVVWHTCGGVPLQDATRHIRT